MNLRNDTYNLNLVNQKLYVSEPGIYYRFILAPEDLIPSEWEYKKLLDFDKRTFGENHGTLTRLPEKVIEND